MDYNPLIPKRFTGEEEQVQDGSGILKKESTYEKPFVVGSQGEEKGQKGPKSQPGKRAFTVFHRFRGRELLPGREMCFGFGLTFFCVLLGLQAA